jgi:hypothetical protein
MKWIYVLIVLMIAASTLGCVDKNQAGTKTPAQTSVSPGEAVVTPGAVLTPAAPGSPAVTPEDLFGTESNLSALDTTFNDMNMEISLLDSI